jgi:hypothetical protein
MGESAAKTFHGYYYHSKNLSAFLNEFLKRHKNGTMVFVYGGIDHAAT